MAASTGEFSWRDELNNLEFCKLLKERNGKEYTKKNQNDSKSLICIYSSDLYVWDQSESQIITCNLKSLSTRQTPEDDSNPSKQSYGRSILDLYKHKDEDNEKSHFQKLLVSCGVTLDVDNLTVNRCGSHIALWGSRGVKVVELPRRWGKHGKFEGGKEAISCRAIDIGDRSLSRNYSLRIRQVSWHPGSKTDSHIAVLSSDNMFRVYNMHDPDEPVNTVSIITGDASMASPNKTLVSSALGETTVAFDFGMPVTLTPKNRPGKSFGGVSPVDVWPVYCVRGNGDVLILYSYLSNTRQLQFPVQGPIMMHPPAEDNYGVDACSILCLPTPVPVVLVSTCEGRVHHCVQLPGEVDNVSIMSEPPSPGQPRVSPYEAIPEPMLFVIETAELELCLATVRLDELPDMEEDFMCPVKLRKDPVSSDRYHCLHSAGVHSVALPWVNLVQQYLLEDSGDFGLPEDKICVVEHLVCTKPLHSCPLAPVLGLDVISDLTLGPHLIILSSEYEFTTLPIGLQYRVSPPSSLGDDGDGSSAHRRASREPFSQTIAQLLQRKTSHPLLKSSSSAELSQQECFQLLSRATQVLREEYIQRQDHARQEIDTRISILRSHKDQQLIDLHALVASKSTLREGAHRGADRLEGAKDNQQRLLTRLEGILHRLQARSPSLSEAERLMMRELQAVKANMAMYQQNVEQVRTKQQYQDRQMTQSPSGSRLVLKAKQLTQIHSVLMEEANEIQDLKNDINRLSINLS